METPNFTLDAVTSAESPVAAHVPDALTFESLRRQAENSIYETKLSTIDAIVQSLLQMKKLVVNNAR